MSQFDSSDGVGGPNNHQPNPSRTQSTRPRSTHFYLPKFDLGLPNDSPWKELDASWYAKLVATIIVDTQDTIDKFLELTATRPSFAGREPMYLTEADTVKVNEMREVGNKIDRELNKIWLLLTALESPGEPRFEGQQRGLVPDAAIASGESIPDDAYSRILLAIFVLPGVFATLRSVVMAFADAHGTVAWNAHDPRYKVRSAS